MANASQTFLNQFVINNIIQIPCDIVFEALLPQVGTIKRPYDATEGVKKTNEFGEVVLTYPTAQVVGTNIKMRLDPIRQRGKTGAVVRVEGIEVLSTFKIFLCPNIDVVENDSIFLGSREYQVLIVDRFYARSDIHHFELMCRRVDNL